MPKLIGHIPNKFYLACSGGKDSMFAYNFLTYNETDFSRLKGVIYINHRTDYSLAAERFVKENVKTQVSVRTISQRLYTCSKEAWWREERYRLLELEAAGIPVILVHNLNDCMESYVFNSMVRGYIDTIPYKRGICIRPFMLWNVKSILRYNFKHNIKWIEDPSNDNDSFVRNRIRHKVIPEILKVNPGLEKIVRKKITKRYLEVS